jgi:hypothetical protein
MEKVKQLVDQMAETVTNRGVQALSSAQVFELQRAVHAVGSEEAEPEPASEADAGQEGPAPDEGDDGGEPADA